MTKVILSTPTKDTSGINMDMKFIDVHVSSAVNVDISISVIVEAELNLGLDNALTASFSYGANYITNELASVYIYTRRHLFVYYIRTCHNTIYSKNILLAPY